MFHIPLSTVQRCITGNTPLRCLVVEAELLQAVHQVVQSLPLLVDNFPVICQGVEQSLSLRDYQTPAEIRSRDRDKDHSVHLGHRQASKHQGFSGSGY